MLYISRSQTFMSIHKSEVRPVKYNPVISHSATCAVLRTAASSTGNNVRQWTLRFGGDNSHRPTDAEAAAAAERCADVASVLSVSLRLSCRTRKHFRVAISQSVELLSPVHWKPSQRSRRLLTC